MIKNISFLKYNILIIIFITTCSIGNSVFAYYLVDIKNTDGLEKASITITPAGPYCTGDQPVTLQATPSGGTWSGNGITSPEFGTFDPGVAGFGLHTITYTLATESGSITIAVNNSPEAKIVEAGPFCISDDKHVFQLTSSSVLGGTWSGNGITNPYSGEFSPSIAGEGEHVIRYEVTQAPCNGNDFIIVTVIDVEAKEITIVPEDPFCFNSDAVYLSATPSGGTWSGRGIIDSQLGLFKPSSASLGLNTITYTFKAGSCSKSESIVIEVMDSPDATIIEAGPFCTSDSLIILEASPSSGIWMGDGITNKTKGIFDPKKALIGENEILYVLDNENCRDTARIFIEVFSGFSGFNYILKEPECYGDSALIELVTLGGTEPFMFSWEDGAEYSSIFPKFYVSAPGSYIFSVTDLNGCYAKTDIVVVNESNNDCLDIPNAFTPNGDGINDIWIIGNLDNFPDTKITIYNRWGQVVYKTSGTGLFWDGTYLGKGKQLPEGQYIYDIRLNRNGTMINGIVTIIR